MSRMEPSGVSFFLAFCCFCADLEEVPALYVMFERLISRMSGYDVSTIENGSFCRSRKWASENDISYSSYGSVTGTSTPGAMASIQDSMWLISQNISVDRALPYAGDLITISARFKYCICSELFLIRIFTKSTFRRPGFPFATSPSTSNMGSMTGYCSLILE